MKEHADAASFRQQQRSPRNRRLRPGERAGQARGRCLVRPLQPDARGRPVRRGEPRHRYPDARGDEGHRAVGPALQGGRRRVHDHDGDDQPRHRPAGEKPDHLRAQGKHPGHGALFRPEAVQAISGAGQQAGQPAARRRRGGHARPHRRLHRPAGAGARKRQRRDRRNLARGVPRPQRRQARAPGPAVGDRADRPQGRAA